MMLYIIKYQFLLASKQKECLLKIYTQEIANIIAKRHRTSLLLFFHTKITVKIPKLLKLNVIMRIYLDNSAK